MSDKQEQQENGVEKKHTDLPWRWFTSNSTKRLSSEATGKDGDVAYAYVAASDGLADICIKESDMEFMELACNSYYTLLRQRAELVGELKHLMRGYINLLNAGRDRILSLGGSCDPVDVMEASDPYLIQARNALRAGGGE